MINIHQHARVFKGPPALELAPTLGRCGIAVETHETGLALVERYNLSIYVAMIAASALDADCDTLRSEDIQHGMVLDGLLRIANRLARRDDRTP